MGQIQIFFGGICIYFEQYLPDANPAVHRMVLLNANVPEVTLRNGQPLPVSPHIARLSASTPFTVSGNPSQMPPPLPLGNNDDSFLLNGVGAYRIVVSNPVETQGWTNGACCLPHLQDTLSPGVSLGPPLSSVLNGGEAACYVDFSYGNIVGNTVPSSLGLTGIAVATVQTNGNPILAIMSNNAGPFPALLTFNSANAVISITNKGDLSGSTSRDIKDDFYLNFKICETLPTQQEITIPTTVRCPLLNGPLPPVFPHFEVGPGCSNTNFP